MVHVLWYSIPVTEDPDSPYSGAEPKRLGEGLQSLFMLVRFQPAPPSRFPPPLIPSNSSLSPVRYPLRRGE